MQNDFTRSDSEASVAGRFSDSQQDSTAAPDSPQTVLVHRQSDLPSDTTLHQPQQSQIMQYSVGDWVMVKYDGCLFPGEIKMINQGEAQVSVMVPSGSYFKWPSVVDSIFYSFDNIVKKLNPPELKSARGTFEFPDY